MQHLPSARRTGRAAARRRFVVFLAVVVVAFAGAAVNAFASQPPALDELDGQLMVAHGDNFAGMTMTMSAVVRTAHGNERVRVPASQHGQFMALAGHRVRVRGHRTAAAFSATTVSGTGGAVAASVPTTGSKRIAVVLVHAPGSTTEPWTKASVQAAFFGTSNSVASWFSEVSDGATSVTGDVYGYYDIGVAANDCTLSDWQNAAAVAAAKDGYVGSNYQHIVVVSPDISACGFSGIAWIGANGVWLNGTDHPGVAEHELGHNLTLRHAGTLDCGSQIIGGSCARSDYGDPFDVMGDAGGNHHYNAIHANVLGYLPSAEVKTVTSGSQTITLTSSEQPVTGATELVDVVAANGTKFGIDKRSSFGYDAGLSGVWIRQIGLANTDDTTLFDMTPATNTFTDGNLAAGNTFVDPVDNISIRTNSEDASTASITVTINGGTTTTTAAPATTTTLKPTTTTVKPTTTTTSPPPTTTTTTTTPPPPLPPPTTAPVALATDGKTVTVLGTAGADVLRAWKPKVGHVSIDANGAPFTLGTGCTAAAGVATCNGNAVSILGGDGNDRITVSGALSSVQNGGNGDDWMVGGTSADVFWGGAGVDTVDYTSRTGGITGTPGTGADDGRKREHDNIEADVEQVIFPAARLR